MEYLVCAVDGSRFRVPQCRDCCPCGLVGMLGGVLGVLGGVRGKEAIGDRMRGLRYLLVVREDSLSIGQV